MVMSLDSPPSIVSASTSFSTPVASTVAFGAIFVGLEELARKVRTKNPLEWVGNLTQLILTVQNVGKRWRRLAEPISVQDTFRAARGIANQIRADYHAPPELPR